MELCDFAYVLVPYPFKDTLLKGKSLSVFPASVELPFWASQEILDS